MNKVAIRLDVSQRIGSGHAMRCGAIANALADQGSKYEFIVSNEESARYLEDHGFDSVIIPGNPLLLTAEDAADLANYCIEKHDAILIDTYAVNDDFLWKLRESFPKKIAYLDDQYTFKKGISLHAIYKPVDLLINYSFYSESSKYEETYSGTSTQLLLGPRFAPVGKDFSHHLHREFGSVERMMVTSGATNPGGFLERVVIECTKSAPSVEVDVVVGPLSQFVFDDPPSNVHVLRNVDNMADVMRKCDIAISSAGSTLYELTSLGVPTITIPLVENQLGNAHGFINSGYGVGFCAMNWSDDELRTKITSMVKNVKLRLTCVRKMARARVGEGASLIARALIS